MKVLLVEDEILIALDLEAMLVRLGHTVCGIAATANNAITLADRHRPDVVVMDIQLANGSVGTDAAREILDKHGIRCIFASGNLDRKIRHSLTNLQPIDFLHKPVRFASLEIALSKVRRAQQ